MRVSMRFAVIVAVVTMGLTTLSLGTTGSAAAQAEQRYLLLAGGQLPANLDALVASVGGRLVHSFDEIGVAAATSAEPMFEVAASTLPGIRAVVPDAVATADFAGAEVVGEEFVVDEGVVAEGSGGPPISNSQWNLRVIRAKEAWYDTLGSGATVAVLDSGIDAGHPGFLSKDATGKVVTAVDTKLSKSYVCETMASGPACTAPGSPESLRDLSAHGTHVAGIIATRATLPGVAPQAKLISVKVLKWDAMAEAATGDETDVIAGILYAVKAGAHIINMSLGFTFATNDRDAQWQLVAMNRAVNYAFSHGVLIVASVGNGKSDLDRNRNLVKAPAQITHVIAVSATGPLNGQDPDKFAEIYSDYGSSTVFVAAPGGNLDVDADGNRMTPTTDWIISLCSRQTQVPQLAACRQVPMAARAYGTSQAAAHVSGLAALVVSKFINAGTAVDPAQARAIIQQSADDVGKPGKDEFYGFGRINAFRAVTGK